MERTKYSFISRAFRFSFFSTLHPKRSLDSLFSLSLHCAFLLFTCSLVVDIFRVDTLHFSDFSQTKAHPSETPEIRGAKPSVQKLQICTALFLLESRTLIRRPFRHQKRTKKSYVTSFFSNRAPRKYSEHSSEPSLLRHATNISASSEPVSKDNILRIFQLALLPLFLSQW